MFKKKKKKIRSKIQLGAENSHQLQIQQALIFNWLIRGTFITTPHDGHFTNCCEIYKDITKKKKFSQVCVPEFLLAFLTSGD